MKLFRLTPAMMCRGANEIHMPANKQSKKSPRPVKKSVTKTAPRASFSRVMKPPPVTQPPEDGTQPSGPVTVVTEAETVLPEPKPEAPPVIPETPTIEHLENIPDSDPKGSRTDRNNTIIFWIGIVITLGIIAVSAGIFVLYLRSAKANRTVLITKPAPTAVPESAFSRSTVTFEVINASGVSGSAAKSAAVLTRAGYTVVTVASGKKQAKSELLLATSLSDTVKKEILADTGNLFSISSSSGDLKNSTASARLVIGVK
jgi:hypothetical protein